LKLNKVHSEFPAKYTCSCHVCLNNDDHHHHNHNNNNYYYYSGSHIPQHLSVIVVSVRVLVMVAVVVMPVVAAVLVSLRVQMPGATPADWVLGQTRAPMGTLGLGCSP
jgi:hypothetical protein